MQETDSKRRKVLTQALQVAGLAALGQGCASAQAKLELKALERIVTGEDEQGRSTRLFRNDPLQTLEFNGSRVYRLWETYAVPTTLPITSDRGADAGNAYRDGFGGTSLYIADIPAGVAASKVPMHQENSLDYMAVLSGEIVLLLETEEVVMRTGDVLVQGGNLHGWENRAAEPCRLLVVALRATRV